MKENNHKSIPLISRLRPYFLGQAVTAFFAFIVVMTTNYGGFYFRRYDTYEYIYVGGRYDATFLILAGAVGLFLALYASLKNLTSKNASPRLLKENTQKAMIGAGYAITLSLASVFVIAILSNLTDRDWWLGFGFYGSIIAGALTFFIGKRIIEIIDLEKVNIQS